MSFLLPRSLVCTAPSTQGHIEAAATIGCIYYWGQGVAVDYARALAAYKIGAEAGDAGCQCSLGFMLSHEGYGVDQKDYKQAVVWYEKAAAQESAEALNSLAEMVCLGRGQDQSQPSWRRAIDLLQRASGLGCQDASINLQCLKNGAVQKVTLARRRALWPS